MTWNAHQLFIEPSEAARRAALSLPGAAGHLYEVPEIWSAPRQVQGAVIFRPGPLPLERELPPRLLVPPGGLLVLRELCALEPEDEWFGDDALGWDQLAAEHPPPDDPLLDCDRLFDGAPDWWQGNAPPATVLSRFRDLAIDTASTVAYYSCQMWGDVECSFGWVWPGAGGPSRFFRSVVGKDAQGKETTGFYTDVLGVMSHDVRGKRFVANADVLSLIMIEFGLLLDGGYFEPHTRQFPWQQYLVECAETEGA